MSRKRGGTDKGEQQNEEGSEKNLPISMTVATDLKAIKRCIPAFAVAFSGGFLVSVLDPFGTQLIIAFDLCGCSTNLSKILVDNSCYMCKRRDHRGGHKSSPLRRGNPGMPIDQDFLRVREGGPTKVNRWVYNTGVAIVRFGSDWVRNLRGES